jgi:spore coat protein H
MTLRDYRRSPFLLFLSPFVLGLWLAGGTRGADELFKSGSIPSFEIVLGDAEYAMLNVSNRSYVRGTFKAGELILTNVGVRLKGRSTFQPLDRKPSFTIKFNQFTPQAYSGFTKLMLNNAGGDPTYLREYLANQLFRDAGLPAPRVTHARVTLNSRSLGLFVAIEGITKGLLRQYFVRTDGNLYEGAFRDVDRRLEQDGGSDHSQQDLIGLARVAKIEDPADRWQRLQTVLDIKRFITFVAMEHLVGQQDGYAVQANNYRIYHDPEADRMVFFPHGLDRTFLEAHFSPGPSSERILTAAVFRTHEGRQMYRQTVEALFTNVFHMARLTNDAVQTAERIYKFLESDKAAVHSNCLALCEVIAGRLTNIAQELRKPELHPAEFDGDVISLLSQWQPSGASSFECHRSMSGNYETLHIRATNDVGSGSFRARLLLEPGQYTFAGAVRMADVQPSTESYRRPGAFLKGQPIDAGVLFHVVGKSRNDFLTGTSDWKELSRPFSVEYGPEEIEVACELIASTGQAWFQTSSLKLFRHGNTKGASSEPKAPSVR